ncbi:hypothetical protein LPJ61_001237 [Coemansia biformis]|uniref:Beta-catenin-like protein 1 N-terminal domain-containing protein n=1 Tax=Coemansia biformis TaxID=1286918 RepID=A0A9W8D0V4_9FUNG|nr:hypothetical protein LPJ61_001237 [Coemansia biformis]
MDINDIFKESVTSTTLGGSRSRRRVGAAPSLRELKEGGYGIVVNGGEAPAKRARIGDDDSTGSAGGSDDDEGGRFFSDGLTAAEKGVMAWVDRMEEMDDALDRAAVQRLVVRLERAVSKNTEDRIAHAQAPEKFAESEAELDEALQRLLVLANDVQQLTVLDQLGAVPTLVGLVAHENADIALDVIQLVAELTAEDAWSQEGESQEERAMVVEFVTRMAQSELFEMLGQNLRRLDEGSESAEGEADRQGVFQTLALVENLVSLDVPLAERAVGAMGLLAWLQDRVCRTYAGDGTQPDANRQYAAEAMSVLLQASPAIRHQADGAFMDALLRCLAKYRKHTPDDGIEMEYLENIVDSVCMLVTTPAGKQAFLEGEGVELMVLLQKQQQVGCLLSLKILDYALSPPPPPPPPSAPDHSGPARADGSADADKGPCAIARRYIDGMGIKYLFAILMHRGKGDMKKLHRKHPESDERAVSCIAWLLRLTERGTPLHWRVLAKFVPSPADPVSWKTHIDRIVELNMAWFERVRDADDRFGRDDDGDGDSDAEERYLSRMDAGLFSLQMADIVIAFVAEEEEPGQRIEQQLRRKGRSMAAVRSELAEYIATRTADTLGAAGRSSGADTSGAGSGLSGLLQQL